MASFEEQFYLENPSRWRAWQRDVRLLLWLARNGLLWLTRGVLVRRAYRRAQLQGEPLVLEDILKD